MSSIIGVALVGNLVWNALTDWVWVSNGLGILPAADIKDINNRTRSIIDNLESARGMLISAQKARRQLNLEEKNIIKSLIAQAEKDINSMRIFYTEKMTLYNKKSVVQDLESALENIRLRIKVIKQEAGLIPAKKVSAVRHQAGVVTVIDGDTIVTTNDENIRLVGIDAPESTTDAGVAAKNFLKNLIEKKWVIIESDPNAEFDMYNRRLGVLFLQDKNINVEMLKSGHADFYEFEENALVFKKQWKAAADEGRKKIKAAGRPAAGGGGAKTFTKIIQIVVGKIAAGGVAVGPDFAVIESDLLASVDAIEQSAQENLIAFLAALPKKIEYEIKIVPSIRTKDGTVITGAAQKIQTGINSAGEPRFKTIFNKFAVLKLYFKTEKMTRTLLGTYTLGPVDAMSLTAEKLRPINIAAPATNLVATVNEKDVPAINHNLQNLPPAPQQPTPAATPTPAQQPTPAATPTPAQQPTPAAAPAAPIWNYNEWYKIRNATGFDIFRNSDGAKMSFADMQPKFAAGFNVDFVLEKKSPVCSATNLTEFFAAKNQPLPSVANRGTLYGTLGLGIASLYAGTLDQNSRLLNRLQTDAGCG